MKSQAEQKFKYYRRFIDAIESNIFSFYETIATEVEAKFEFPNEETKNDVVSDAIYEEADDYDFTLYSAFIIALYSYLEHTTNVICKHYEKGLKSKVLLSDLRDDGIIRSKTFLTKIVEINFSDINSLWEDVITLGKVRNVLVHNGKGEKHFHKIDELPKNFQRFIELGIYEPNAGHCKGCHIGELRITKNYCLKSLETVNTIIIEILTRLPDLPVLL